MSEKLPLVHPATGPPTGHQSRPSQSKKRFLIFTTLSTLAYVLLSRTRSLRFLGATNFAVSNHGFDEDGDYSYLCPQVEALVPSENGGVWNELVKNKLGTDEFKTKAVAWLSGAVQVKTESFDKMDPVGVDPRWDAFGPFHDYLSEAFPLVHSTLSVTKVNTWGLVYTWEGSDDSLKPVLLAAHQDVVPVNPDTVDEWEHPPYSGHFDGERIWGRGSSDDKSGLIGILASIETLIESGFKPTRKVVLASGFDEESSGLEGAYSLAGYLLPEFGENGFAFIIDEGSGFVERYDNVFAFPAVTEKGYIDVRIDVASPGGHSSVPPPHTSIGILAALLVEYEANPYKTKLSRNTVTYDYVKCWAAHSPKMPSELRKAIIQSTESDRALKDAESILFKDPLFKALAGTTQAIDLIGGGVKVNALPEDAFAVVNHRIAVDSSVADIISKDTALVKPLAEKFNLSLTAFGTQITDPSQPSFGSLVLYDAWGSNLEPAPITPYTGKESAAYQLLSGTIKSVYNVHRGLEGNDNIKVQPGYMTGNTDTRYYWKLSPNIFRYNHHNQGRGGLGNAHTVNEFLPIDSLVEMTKFFTTLILNADETKDL